MRKALRFRFLWPFAILTGVVVGQTLRLDLIPGSSGQISFLDLMLGGSLVAMLIWLLVNHQLKAFCRYVWQSPIWRWSAVFLGWALISLWLNAFDYTLGQLFAAKAYLVRLAAAFGVMWFAAYTKPSLKEGVTQGFLVAAALLVLLGFLQYIFVSDFRFMVQYGWDPHIGRLLSSFYDPNYFGVFLALVMAVSLGAALMWEGKRRWLAGILFIAAWIALYLTFSRSAWIAGAVAAPLTALRKDWRLALAIFLVFVGSLFLPTRLGERFQSSSSLANNGGLSGQSIKCTDQQLAENLCDQSGSARFYSYQQGWAVFKSSPIYGVGYNAYGYALTNGGFARQDRLDMHSASGSDSSVLNIAATTGVIGLLIAIIFFIRLLFELGKRAVKQEDAVLAGLFWFTVAWLAASFFNNSLLYILILAPWALLVGVALSRDTKWRPG